MKKLFDKLSYSAKKNGFLVNQDKEWLFFEYDINNLPSQGWKLHMNSIMPEIKDFVKDISSYCFKEKINWKILNTEKKLERAVFGGVPYSQTGKQITIYMNNNYEFEKHIKNLDIISRRYEGVVVPFDKMFAGNTCLYYRYGSFKPIIEYSLYNSMKESFLIIDNKIRKDIKNRGYNPYGVHDPVKELSDIVSFTTSEKLKKLKLNYVLKQGGKGGVYQGYLQNLPIVLKEGRKNFQADSKGHTVIDRIKNEYT